MTKLTKETLLDTLTNGRHVLVMAGVSGAGKSTLAKAVREHVHLRGGHARVVSADDFFIDPATHEYRFDPTKLPEAHALCLRTFDAAVTTLHRLPYAVLVVDNTNTTVAEAAPYYALATAFGWNATLLHVTTPALVAGPRNVHGVSSEGVMAQAGRLARLGGDVPRFWNVAEIGGES